MGGKWGGGILTWKKWSALRSSRKEEEEEEEDEPELGVEVPLVPAAAAAAAGGGGGGETALADTSSLADVVGEVMVNVSSLPFRSW